MKKRTLVLGALSIFVGLAGWTAWRWIRQRGETSETVSSEDGKKPIDIDVEGVRVQPVNKTFQTYGNLISAQMINITSSVDGTIKEMNCKPGSEVVAGQVLIKLDDALYKSKVTAAKALLDPAEKQYRRYEALSSKDLMSKQKLEEASGQYQKALADYETAKLQLAETSIRAPFSGFIGLHTVALGQYINSRQDLGIKLSTRDLYVDFFVPSVRIPDVFVDQEVCLILDEREDILPVFGTVLAIEPEVSPTTHNLRVRAQFSNENKLLKPGQYVRVTFDYEKVEDAVVVRADALDVLEDGKSTVFVVVEKAGQRIALKQSVTVKSLHGSLARIAKGDLPVGIPVVVKGNRHLQSGTPVSMPEDESLKIPSIK